MAGRELTGVVGMTDLLAFQTGYQAQLEDKTDEQIKADIDFIVREVKKRDDYKYLMMFIARSKNKNVIGWFWDPTMNKAVANWIEIEDASQAAAIAAGNPAKRTPLNRLETAVFGFDESRDADGHVVITPKCRGLGTQWIMEFDDFQDRYVLRSVDLLPSAHFYCRYVYVQLSPGLGIDIKSITYTGEDTDRKPQFVYWNRSKIEDLKSKAWFGSP